MNKKIRYAVVGLGHITQTAVLPAFKHAKIASWRRGTAANSWGGGTKQQRCSESDGDIAFAANG